MAQKINNLNFEELKRKSFFKLAMLIYLSAILTNIFYVISSYNNNLIASAIITLFPLVGFCISVYVLLVRRNYLAGPYIVYIVLGISTVCLSYLEGLMSGYYWYQLGLIFVLPYVIRHEVYFQKHTNILYSMVFLFIVTSVLISPMYSVYYEHLTHEQTHFKFILNSLVCFVLTMIFSMQALTHNKSYIKRIYNDKKQAVSEKDRRTKVLSNLGHELRTQINSINGVTQLILGDTPNKAPNTKYFEILDHCNNNMLLLVNDMLDIHKIESGLFELINEPKVLYDFLNKITIPFIGKAEEKNLELHSQIDSKLVGIVVSIDEKRFAQVIYNLISNAIKFTEQGRITFSAELINLDNDTVEIQFSVIDTGIGIAPNNIKKVFESFHQITNENNPVYGGTGLGLAISQSIIEAMNSEIKIESKLNKGTCFKFTLTLKRLAFLPNKLHKEEIFNIDFLMSSSVLLVEDNMISMMYAKKLLEKHVTKIYEATNGVEAILKVKSYNDIDLVFLDLEMPQMNGFKAISHIKEHRPNLIVIAFTANIPSTELINKLDDLGFDDILSKPFSKQDVFAILKKYDKTLVV
ncbi:hybrid sensor histidine kinase/response regulator [Mariniflexile gromovii]|uniref:histidine kinase n=1 Tax=Mariniflexile gromovii TaxID=362523 RepID=A0ABS4BP84_9FLAO|nr:ATP-binding protein [Mariniflexile gromovii]MBP0902332.1 response regulator [Mariniflexile gromovii]